MITIGSIKSESELAKRAKELLDAGHEYWKEYQKVFDSCAVIWLEADNGHFMLFTRSEYKKAITDVVWRENMFFDEPLEHPFEPSSASLSPDLFASTDSREKGKN